MFVSGRVIRGITFGITGFLDFNMSVDELIITAKDCRAAGICIRDGARPFCLRNNINFRDFMRDGVTASVLISTNEPLAIELVKFVQRAKNV
jgi:hypothetical protein